MHDMREVRRGLMFATALLLMVALAGPAWAVDGVIEINQARAMKGGVTPGDEPAFPVTITQPGSYRLTGNLTVPDANTIAVEITTDNVTVDLNGFAIIGPGGAGSGVGIFALNKNNITVVNGTVRGMSDGISLLGKAASVEKVRAVFNSGLGIFVWWAGRVTGNIVHSNGGVGIRADASTVTGNMVNQNAGDGIVGLTSTVTGNIVRNNGGSGIFVESGLVIGNSVHSNVGAGITGAHTGYANNVLRSNNNEGVQVSGGIQMGPNVCGLVLCP